MRRVQHSGNLWNLFQQSYKNKLPAVFARFPNALTHQLSQEALRALQSFHLPRPSLLCRVLRSGDRDTPVGTSHCRSIAQALCLPQAMAETCSRHLLTPQPSAFLTCPSLNRLSYPPMDTVPLLLSAIATSPVGFMLLARLQVPALPLLLTLHTLIRGSLVRSGM